MGKYIKLFSTTAEYENAKSSLDLPNVSVCEDALDVVHYNPWVETRVVAKFNVTSTSSPTQICGYYVDLFGRQRDYSSGFTSIEVDGVILPTVTYQHQFDTIGEHIVKYTLLDPTSISYGAFWDCSGLSSITIPNSVTSIGSNAFKECSGLTSIDIPDSVTSIGNEAFNGCSSLPIVDNIRYADTCAVEATDKTLSTYILKNNTKLIGDRAFRYCSGLTSITIPNSVTSISQQAFYQCNGLTNIDIPNSVTSIGKMAFQDCTGLTSCTIGSGVTSIGDSAFSGCKSLTSIVIPNSVTSIGDSAFYQCSGLTTCTIGSGVTSISQQAFYQCNGLTNIDIPNSVTSIGNSAFAACSGLTSVTIGSGVTSIGNYAFKDCNNLTSITSNATTAPTITMYTFQNVKESSNGRLYVPIGSSGYDTWMQDANYYLRKYHWTKVEQ